ncbi:MAG: folate-binding protein, partial [Frankia sp.]|nr:folate-binding protein [Frankia sp.]
MLSPLLSREGAVAGSAADAGVAAHYGDPFREQRAMAESCSVVDRSHRGVIRIDGGDRRSWLHSLTTQHLESLPDRYGAESLVLSPHGHIEHHLVLGDDGDAMEIDVEPGTAGALVDFLESMRFLLDVKVSDVSEAWALLTLVGPDTTAVLDKVGLTLPPDPYALAPAPWRGGARRMPWPGAEAADLVVLREHLADIVAELESAGATLAGVDAFEAFRVADRRPRLGFETDHRTIPHEVGWLESAVHLDKGCYRGQETVARVHNLGRPPRRLLLLHLDGTESALPLHGDAVQ